MTIDLPEYLEQFVHEQVKNGLYGSDEEVIRDALEQLWKHAQPTGNSLGSLGAMRDAADELDEVVAHAMELRKQPWRALPREYSSARYGHLFGGPESQEPDRC